MSDIYTESCDGRITNLLSHLKNNISTLKEISKKFSDSNRQFEAYMGIHPGDNVMPKAQYVDVYVRGFEELLQTLPVMTVQRVRYLHHEQKLGKHNAMFVYILLIGSHFTPGKNVDTNLDQQLQLQLQLDETFETLDGQIQFCFLKVILFGIQGSFYKVCQMLEKASALLCRIHESDLDQGYKNMMEWAYILLYKNVVTQPSFIQTAINKIHHLELNGSFITSMAKASIRHEKSTLRFYSYQPLRFHASELLSFKDPKEAQMEARSYISVISQTAWAYYSYSYGNKNLELVPDGLQASIYWMLEFIQAARFLSISERVIGYWRKVQFPFS